jgi:hypothetical protein
MDPAMIPDADFAARLEAARAYRARVDELPERAEVDAAVRATVKSMSDRPEPPAKQAQLIAEIVELLENARLTPWQAHELERAFFTSG